MVATMIKRTAEFKAAVALEALRGERTTRELAALHGVTPRQVTLWKRHVEEHLAAAFENRPVQAAKTDEGLREEVAQLKLELDWLRKKLPYNPAYKRLLIDWDNPRISIARQYRLLGLSRSSHR